MQLELKLKNWTGTITYGDLNRGTVFATRPAHVYVSNDLWMPMYDESIAQGLVVGASIGCPYEGSESILRQ